MTTYPQPSESLTSLTEQYLGLESMEITEVLLELWGARIDSKALPLLKQRLQEEEAQIPVFVALGYIRMREKSQQLVQSLASLIRFLEQAGQENNI